MTKTKCEHMRYTNRAIVPYRHSGYTYVCLDCGKNLRNTRIPLGAKYEKREAVSWFPEEYLDKPKQH